MQAKLYLETTIPSYLAGRPSRDLVAAAHQEITRDWWESRRSEFDLYVSELVVQEVRAGDALLASQRLELLRNVPILPVRSEILKLAGDLVAKGPIPRKAAGDANTCCPGTAATSPMLNCAGQSGGLSKNMDTRRRACARRKN